MGRVVFSIVMIGGALIVLVWALNGAVRSF
jgi:hypothetical protein